MHRNAYFWVPVLQPHVSDQDSEISSVGFKIPFSLGFEACHSLGGQVEIDADLNRASAEIMVFLWVELT